MNSGPYEIITPALIRRHNFRCFGRMILWFSGAAAVFLIAFLFAWLMGSLVISHRELSGSMALGASVFAAAFFVGGWFRLKKSGPLDWERIAQKPSRRPGMRLSRMSNQEYAAAGEGFIGLMLAGPDWLCRIRQEWQALIPARKSVAEKLEQIRRHLAARDAWVPIKDFPSHHEDIYLLARLNILSIREMLGQYHFHVTLQGTVKRE